MNSSKKVYMTPMLEVMNARVEKGFAGSGESGDALIPLEPVDPNSTGTTHSGLDLDMD